jgi:hypothetical protein
MKDIYEITLPFQSARRVFLFDSYELVRNRPGLNQSKCWLPVMIMVLIFVQKENCYGCFTSSKMDRLVYWSVFPGLRRRLRVPAKCKAVCDGIVILRTVTCGCPVTGPQRGRELAIAKPPGRPLHTNWASVSWALNEASFRSRDAPRHGFVFEGMT